MSVNLVVHAVTSIFGAAFVPPQIVWTVTPEIQGWSSKGAFVIILIWLANLLMQFAIPSRRGGGGLGRGGAAKFVGVAVLVVIMLDLNLLPVVINNLLAFLSGAANILGIHP